MGRRDPRVDSYIRQAAEFARPILEEIRTRVHAACPGVDETIKWGVPHFDYRGPLCRMAAFKQHCTFGFWKDALMVADQAERGREAMGRGRITRTSDLPPARVFREHVRKAMALNENAVKVPRRAPRAEVPVPKYMADALARNRKARETFGRFPPSHRREYVEWIADAKTEPTRMRRLDQAIAWMVEGKPRNWKYMR
jgi:uncharacterized protein YdeI (YjbR/CyaY-like superfamily)